MTWGQLARAYVWYAGISLFSLTSSSFLESTAWEKDFRKLGPPSLEQMVTVNRSTAENKYNTLYPHLDPPLHYSIPSQNAPYRFHVGAQHIGPINSVLFELWSQCLKEPHSENKESHPENKKHAISKQRIKVASKAVKGCAKTHASLYESQLASIHDSRGRNVFNKKSRKLLEQAKVPLPYIKDLLEIKDHASAPLLRGYQIYRYCRLGMTRRDIEDFHDTPLPNAVIMYPFEDENPKTHGSAFDNDHALEIFHRISEKYDVWVQIAYHEDQIYAALDRIPAISLVMIAGHGDAHNLGFAKKNPFTGKDLGEKGVFDTGDVEFRKHTSNLLPEAVIFLSACSNGKGGVTTQNLANRVYFWTQGRKVISSTIDFSMSDVSIKQIYPFDACIENDGKDYTFVRDSLAGQGKK